MASIVDSIKSVFSDNFSLLKLGGFAAVIYLVFKVTVPSPAQISSYGFFGILMTVFAVGFVSIVMHNRIHQKLEMLPIVNPMTFVNVSIKGMAVLVPYLIVGFFVVSFVIGLFNFDGIPQMIAIWIIRLLFLAMALTALMYYSNDYQISDGYGLSKILTGFQDILVYMFACLIVIFIFNAFTVIPVLYFAYSYFDIGPAFYFVIIFGIIMDVAIMADYCAQLWFDLDSKNSYYS